jgi:hypothetical protein
MGASGLPTGSEPCKQGCLNEPGHLAGDLDQVLTSPADFQHPPVSPRMREIERLAESMRAVQAEERPLQIMV